MSDTTAPPFCAMPSWSKLRMCRPAMVAAVEMTCAVVTTPVPPMPVMRMLKWSKFTFRTGSGRLSDSSGAAVLPAFGVPGVTTTNEGQSPSRQE